MKRADFCPFDLSMTSPYNSQCRGENQSTVYFEPLFRVFVPLFRFSTTVLFFLNRTKRKSVFSYHCSVFALLCRFPITEQKRTSVFCTTVPCFRTTVPFFALLFRFSTMEQKRNSVFCTTVPCFCFTVPCLHHCSVFALLFRFFALLFRFFHKGTKNLIVYFVPLFRVYVPLFRFSTTVPFFPQIEGTSHSVSRRQRNETFPNRKGNK